VSSQPVAPFGLAQRPWTLRPFQCPPANRADREPSSASESVDDDPSSSSVDTTIELLFARHVDLAPLRGRRRGLVLCIFHEDRRPSLSVDLDQGLFHCFGCGVGGGVRTFVRLVRGDDGNAESPRRHRHVRRDRAEEHSERVAVADALRTCFHVVDAARRRATRLGDTTQAWSLLALAARADAEAWVLEAEVDNEPRRGSRP